MEPFYMNMHPFPHREQMHYRPRCYSGMEGRPPMSYGCWPWGGNYGYVAPGACHCCSNHGYAPSYCSWGSPYSHPPPHHCHGSYQCFPVQYMPPPPYNVMERPRYEFEKNVPADGNCCGCPRHRKEQRNVRIEEEEPEKERRKDDSLTPLQFRNLPNPIMWFQPDCKEQAKVRDTDGGKDDSRDVKVVEDGKTVEQQQPTSWKGWFPIALNNVVPPKDMGNKVNNHREDSGKKNPQFPLLWMPYKPDDAERQILKVKDVDAKPSLESEKVLDGDEKFRASKGNLGDHTASKVKDIPVKEVEQNAGEKCSALQEKEKGSSVGSQRKSQSPPKASKLPPVCLRVDPLPRKKPANAKLLSPSPPGDKQKLEVKSNGASKAHSSHKEEQVKEDKGTKTIAVVDESTLPSRDLNVEILREISVQPQDNDSMKQAEEKQEEGAQKQTEHDAKSEDTVRGENEEPLMAEGVKTDDVKKCRELSEEEAAVIIQAAYRRFDVCRWEPIKKLKQIAGVRERIADVKRQLQELELSCDVQGRAKQKNIISETIMSLLLKLDMIQGQHPSTREVRKSVVRELVGLQEQLDASVNNKPENLSGQEPMMRDDHEDAPYKSAVTISPESGNEVDLENQVDEGTKPESPEQSEANMIEEAASPKIEMEAADRSVDGGVQTAPCGTTEDEDNKSSEVLQYYETPILEQGSDLLPLLDDSQASVADSAPTDHDVLQTELPQGVLATESTNQSASEADSSNADQPMEPEDGLIGSTIAQESCHGMSNKENDETVEASEASDRPTDGVELRTEETELGNSLRNCKSGDNLQTADRITRDAGSGNNECTSQQLEEFTADVIDRSEASGESEKINEYSGAIEKEVSSKLLHEGDLGETNVINEDANTYGAVDMGGAERQAETEPNDGIAERNSVVSEEGLPHMAESSPLETEGAVDVTPEMEAVRKQEHPPTKDAAEEDITERNARLMEENERLRDMMEKLIKSGQEQLTAISSLSGRVKDMEKELSRRRKLKLKQSKPPKAGGKTTREM